MARIRSAAGRAVADAAEFALEDANRTVPHRDGTLARSGLVTVDGLTAAISYDTPYAARQHEETTWRHKDGRRAKWLQLSMDENAASIGEYLARVMREAS